MSAAPVVGRRLRVLGALAWGAAAALYLLTVVGSGATPVDVLVAIITFLREHPLGALAYLAVYALRPLLLFPATLLTVAAGLLYGAFGGVALVVVGANVSAVVAYALGRAYGAELGGAALRHPRLQGVAQRLRRNAFEAVLTLRFVFAPYDAVNYLAGTLRLPLRAFVVATVIGSLPGTLVFVFFGAGLGDVGALQTGRLPSPDLPLLVASGALFLTSLLLARVWRAREARAARAAHGAAAVAAPSTTVVLRSAGTADTGSGERSGDTMEAR